MTLTDLKGAVDEGNVKNLRKILDCPKNDFTEKNIDNVLNHLQRIQNVATLDINNTMTDETFKNMENTLSNYKKCNLLRNKIPKELRCYVHDCLGGKKTANKRKNKERKTKRRKMKGGEDTVCATNTRNNCECKEGFIKVNESGNDGICTLCQDLLINKIDYRDMTTDYITKYGDMTPQYKQKYSKMTDAYKKKGSIIYQIGCGHRYHSYCLHTYCEIPNSVKILLKNQNLVCPGGCARSCINPETAMTLDAFAGDLRIMALDNGEQYLTAEYTGVE